MLTRARILVSIMATAGALFSACGPPGVSGFDIQRVDATSDIRDTGSADIARVDVRADNGVLPDIVAPRDIVTSTDDGVPADTGSSGHCVSVCTTDSQCSSSCPPVSTGTWCCQSGTCVFDSNPVCGSTPDVTTSPDGAGETGTGPVDSSTE